MQAPGMAPYRTRTNTTLPPRTDDVEPPSQRLASTRLPMPKHNQRQPQANKPIQHSPSKLTKRRPSNTSEDGQNGRPSKTQDGATQRTVQTKNTKSRAHGLSIAAPPRTVKDSPQPGTLTPSSARAAQMEDGSARTPSLISGSSASTTESPRSNVLRRKPSSIGRSTSRLRKGSVSSQDDTAVIDTLNVLDPFPDSVLGVAMPTSSGAVTNRPYYASQTFPEFPAPPTPFYALSTTPSTGYSGSPGPFSVASTPTSVSSYSPGTIVTSKALARVAQPSPVKNTPAPTRRRTEESEDRTLSSVRESSASSSGSTARASSATRQSFTLQPYPLNARPRTSYDRKAEKSSVEARPRTAMAPPELAHLVDAKPLQQSTFPAKPVRPSREGTPDYIALRDPSPVVQSNLQSIPSMRHRRQSSSESRSAGASTAPLLNRPRIAPPLKLPSRNPSPSPSQMSLASPTTSKPLFPRGITPDQSSDSEGRSKKGVAPSQSPSKTGSRFGFFRRKTEPVTSSSGTTEKRSRKGPAAGTGHEGYGKYSLSRGRSGSTTSGASSGGRSQSADSGIGNVPRVLPSRKSSTASKGTPEMDDFLRDRLAPVTLRGEGAFTPSIAASSRPTSAAGSSDLSIPAVAPIFRSQEELSLARSAHHPVLDAPVSVLPVRGQSPAKRDRSVGPDTQTSGRFGFRALGGKRLSRMSTTSDVAPPMAQPTQSGLPANPKVWKGQPSQGATTRAAPKQKSTAPSSVQPTPKPPGRLTRKWNFFQRSQTVPVKPTPTLQPSPEIQHQPASRSMAHYALAEDRGRIDMDELEQIMQEANESPDEMDNAEDLLGDDPGIVLLSENAPSIPIRQMSGEDHIDSEHDESPNSSRPAHVRSILLPDRPVLPPPGFEVQTRSASPKVHLRRDSPDRVVLSPPNRIIPVLDTAPEANDEAPKSPTSPLMPLPPQRQPRLQQVGRIPQVRRDRERKLSVHSFSRPFGNDGSPAIQQQSPASEFQGSPVPAEEERSAPALNDFVAQLRTESFAEDVEAALDLKRHSAQTATTIDATATDGIENFLAFPPRKDSDISASTSSGHPSYGTLLATAPAALPLAATSMEDEVWGEYDDLIDDVLWTPDMVRNSLVARPAPLNLPSLRIPASDQLAGTQERKTGTNVPLTIDHNSTGPHVVPSLPPIASPNSPYSVTDFLAAYGVKGLSMVTVDTAIRDTSGSAAVRTSTPSTLLSIPSTSHKASGTQMPISQATTLTSSPQALPAKTSTSGVSHGQTLGQSYTDDTSECETASSFDGDVGATEAPTSIADLRFGALMTSKWLSFGRVLFSPAHYELKDPREDRVLVVDGLGKDWSHYVALTYANASVYSLGPEPSAFPSNKPEASGAPIEQMANHRHIHHPDLHAPFPFPKGFFAAVVFRFPSIAAESAYRWALAESKRVLRPGGYLEVSLLDMDPVNMGSRVRKAVKNLKMRIAEQHPEWSLRPMSDVVMKLIGRRGFEGLQRCVLGVPAAGPIKRSNDAGAAPFTQPLASDGRSAPAISSPEHLRAMEETSEPPGISHMVCKVGRWWYDQCYESPTFTGAAGASVQQSIWRDETLLAECERLNTTFRLLICCAQKPTGAVRRTVSV